MKRKKAAVPESNAYVALYNRVSVKAQRDTGISIVDQSERLQAANPAGVLFTDPHAISGGIPFRQRPAGRRIMEEIALGRVSKIVVTKLDRFTRSAIDGMEMLKLLNEYGVGLVVLDWGGMTVDSQTPGGKAFIHSMMVWAEFEKDMISERTRDAAAACLRSGRPWGRAGRGYANDQPEVFRQMQELRDQGLSYQKIADRLNAEGHYPQRGKKFDQSSIRYTLTGGKET